MTALAFWPWLRLVCRATLVLAFAWCVIAGYRAARLLYVALATACRWLRGDRCAACGGMWSFAASWVAPYYCTGCWPHLRRGFARELAVEAARARNRRSRAGAS